MRRYLLIAAGFCAVFAGLASATKIIVDEGDGSPCQIVLTGSTVSTDPNSGDLRAEGTLGTGCPTGVAPPTLAWNPSLTGPTSVAQAQIIPLTWGTVGPADRTCSITGGPSSFPGWNVVGTALAASGSSNVTAQTLGSHTFSISCTFPGNTTPITSSHTVEVTPVSGVCSGFTPPTTPSRQSSGQWYLNAVFQGITNFTDYLYPFSDKGSSGSTPWPGTYGTRTLMIGANSYVALAFGTGTTSFSIGAYSVSQSAQSPAPFYMTLTECAGDFRQNDISPHCQMGPTGKGALYWQIGGSSTFRCVLDLNKTYYLNMVPADPSNLGASLCANTSCGMLIYPNF